MTIKVLLINFPRDEIYKAPPNVEIASCSIGKEPTLHDYHAIIMDVDEVNISFDQRRFLVFDILKREMEEQIKTGGIVFCFSGEPLEPAIDVRGIIHYGNYAAWCPLDLGVISGRGDTFIPKPEEIKYYAPLLKEIKEKDVFWKCYFSKLPENSRVIAVNRAGYCVFAEIPIGSGKLVMLPRFKNRPKAVTTLVNEVIPQIVHEEEPTFRPEWLSEYAPPLEKEARESLREIETAKRLLYTKGKLLKKAAAYALEKLGFSVKILPDGTLPDLEIETDKQKGIVEVKGHDTEQATRSDVLQLVGHLPETKAEIKGIFVSNHQLRTQPEMRKKEAFTEGAIQVATAHNICLLSTIELWRLVLGVLEEKISPKQLADVRTTIMTSTGVAEIKVVES